MNGLTANGDAACWRESVSRTIHWTVQLMSLRGCHNTSLNLNAAASLLHGIPGQRGGATTRLLCLWGSLCRDSAASKLTCNSREVRPRHQGRRLADVAVLSILLLSIFYKGDGYRPELGSCLARPVPNRPTHSSAPSALAARPVSFPSLPDPLRAFLGVDFLFEIPQAID